LRGILLDQKVKSFSYEGAFLLVFFWMLIPSILLSLIISRSVPTAIGFGLMFSISIGLIVGHQYKGMNISIKDMDQKKMDEVLNRLKYSMIEEDGNVKRYCRNSIWGFISPNIFIIDNHEIIGPTMWVKKIKKEFS